MINKHLLKLLTLSFVLPIAAGTTIYVEPAKPVRRAVTEPIPVPSAAVITTDPERPASPIRRAVTEPLPVTTVGEGAVVLRPANFSGPAQVLINALLRVAAGNGHRSIVAWVLNLKGRLRADQEGVNAALRNAVENGRLKIVVYLRNLQGVLRPAQDELDTALLFLQMRIQPSGTDPAALTTQQVDAILLDVEHSKDPAKAIDPAKAMPNPQREGAEFTQKEYGLACAIMKSCPNNRRGYVNGLNLVFSPERTEAIIQRVLDGD